MDVSDDWTTDVVDVADDTPHGTFEEEVFVLGGRDVSAHARIDDSRKNKNKTTTVVA